jgi:hypothetical protein
MKHHRETGRDKALARSYDFQSVLPHITGVGRFVDGGLAQG